MTISLNKIKESVAIGFAKVMSFLGNICIRVSNLYVITLISVQPELATKLTNYLEIRWYI
jgi:hypothetical protein